jgi:predicted acyl esterase
LSALPQGQANLIAADMLAGGDDAYERDFWLDRKWSDLAPDIVSSGVPALMYMSWGETVTGVFDLYVQLQNILGGRSNKFGPISPGQTPFGKYQLFVGNGEHGCCLGDPGVQLQWFDHWLKGKDTGLALNTKTPLHIQIMGATDYINTFAYPFAQQDKVYLMGQSTLDDKQSASGVDTLSWGAPLLGSSVSYDSAPIAKGALLAGPTVVTVYASSTNSNIQLAGAVLDIAPDGSSTEITHGIVVGSLSDIDSNRSWTDRSGAMIYAYPLLNQDRYKSASDVHRYDISMGSKFYRIAPGHFIRLTLGSQYSTQTCADIAGLVAIPYGCFNTTPQLSSLSGGTYSIQKSATYPSALVVPLLPIDDFKPARAALTPTSGGYIVPLDW